MGPPGAATFTLRASKSLPTSKFPVWSSRDKATDKTHHKRSSCILYQPVKLQSVIIKNIFPWQLVHRIKYFCFSVPIQSDLEWAKTLQWDEWRTKRQNTWCFNCNFHTVLPVVSEWQLVLRLTLAASQRGQSEHLLKGECFVFWVLDGQDFGRGQSFPHSIQHRGWVAPRHVWTHTGWVKWIQACMQTRARAWKSSMSISNVQIFATSRSEMGRLVTSHAFSWPFKVSKSKQSDQLMVSWPAWQIFLLTALANTLKWLTAAKPDVTVSEHLSPCCSRPYSSFQIIKHHFTTKVLQTLSKVVWQCFPPVPSPNFTFWSRTLRTFNMPLHNLSRWREGGE